MTKTDYKKTLKEFYRPGKSPVIIDVPEMNFLMIDGKGNPNKSEEFQNAIETLYAVSYKIKFLIKEDDTEKDYVVMPLEGLWWADDMTKFGAGKKDEWFWTVMIMQPPVVTEEVYRKAREIAEQKKNPAALPLLRFESLHEGESVQLMHTGPFSEEAPNIERMHEFAEENGYSLRGKHHEIYLSDFRKVDPAKMKTALRQPVKRKI